jgi:hypothetical protein
LNHQTPFQALQKWYKDKPELFVKNVYDQPGLDTKPPPALTNIYHKE